MKSGWFLATLFTLFITDVVHAGKPHGKLVDEQRFKDYAVHIYRPESGEDCLEILKSGRQVYFKNGFRFKIGNIILGEGSKTNDLIRMGSSITSDKQPNLVVSEWTGGAHCCFVFYVFEIGEEFKPIDSIDTSHGGDSDFKDLRKNGELELVTYDWTFAYWHCGFAESPAPSVILRCQNGKYVPDLELMRKPKPTETDLKSLAKNIQAKFNGRDGGDDLPAPVDLWAEMLNLIYTGNMNAAWRLVDLSWPAETHGRAKFLRGFKKQLSTSPYYREIERLNGYSVRMQ